MIINIDRLFILSQDINNNRKVYRSSVNSYKSSFMY